MVALAGAGDPLGRVAGGSGRLAASEALRELAAPAAPAAQEATPRANIDALGVNCHQGAPPTSSPYLAVAQADAQKYQIDVRTFTWQIWQESGFNPNVVSPAGAEGIAQFLPTTAQGMGIDPRDPRQALDAAARLDARHLSQYAADAQAQHDEPPHVTRASGRWAMTGCRATGNLRI